MSKKSLAAAAAVLSLAACATARSGAGGDGHWASIRTMGPLEAGLLYYQGANVPPDPKLAFAWGEVCGEKDPAARAEALASAQPRLEAAARQVAATAGWSLPLRQTMGAYDLDKRGFATGLRRGSVVRFDRSDFCRQDLAFLVAFRNGDAWSTLRISEEGARRLVRANPARTVVHDLEVEVVGWQPGPPGPTLLVDIVRMRTRDAVSDRLILDSALPEPR